MEHPLFLYSKEEHIIEFKTQFDYYYGDESEQFSFFRIPRLLMTDKRYKGLSTDAKLLYGLMLDRMGLSQRNGWYDAQGRVFIYYPMTEIQEVLDCGHDKAGRLVAELEQGYGLIERVRQGQGKPARIYVKRLTSGNTPVPTSEPENNTPAPCSQDYEKAASHTSDYQSCRLPKIGSQEVSKPDANYTDKNYTDLSYINPSINPTGDCRKSGGEQSDEGHPIGQQEKKNIPSCPLETIGNPSQNGRVDKIASSAIRARKKTPNGVILRILSSWFNAVAERRQWSSAASRPRRNTRVRL